MSNGQPTTHHESIDEPDAEISLGQIIDFFTENWKLLGLGIAASMALGLAGAMMSGTYKAEVTVDTTNSKAINFTSWRTLETRLNFLAAQIVESKLAKPEELDQYRRLSSSGWWKENVIPTYSLSKEATKNLVSISKELQDAESISILYLRVTNSSKNKEAAENDAKFAANFIRTGSTYLTLRNILDRYESRMQTKEANLQQRITETEIELAYMNRRSKGLDDLRLRFPGNVNFAANQIIDPKDSGAKYLPISTQLIAISQDVDSAHERLVRMRNELAQQKIIHTFLDQAAPAMLGQFDGFVLLNRLLKIEAELRNKLDLKDMQQRIVVDNIRAELIALRVSFDKGLDISGITITKPSYFRKVILAGIGGGFLTLLVLIGRRYLINSAR